MSLVTSLDHSPLGFALVMALLSTMLVVSAWLDATRRRHAPHDVDLCAAGLVSVCLAAILGAPIALMLSILVGWGAALAGYEAAWLGWDGWRRHQHRRA